MLFEGDSSATLKGMENVYICAFAGLDPKTLTQFEAIMNTSRPVAYLRCDSSIFITREPLRICGVVVRTPGGVEIDEYAGAGWAKAGLNRARDPSTVKTIFTGSCPKCLTRVKIEMMGNNCDLSWIRCGTCCEDLHYQVIQGQLILKKASDTAKERAKERVAKIADMKLKAPASSLKKEKAVSSRKWWHFWK